MKDFSLFRKSVRNVETATLTSASGTSVVSGAAKFTTSVRDSEVEKAAVMLFLGNGGLLQSRSRLKEAVAIPIGEICGQSLEEKDGKLFFCRSKSRAL